MDFAKYKKHMLGFEWGNSVGAKTPHSFNSIIILFEDGEYMLQSSDKAQPLDEQVLFYHREYFEPGESRNPNSVPKRQREWKERARKTLAQLNLWHQKNWKPEPSNLCIKCPVNKKNGGYCDKGSEIQTI